MGLGAGGGKSRWKLGLGMLALGPLSANVCTNVPRLTCSRVALPKPCCGALRALETTCRPRELRSEAVSRSCLGSGDGPDLLAEPKPQEGAVDLAECGCSPIPLGWEWDPGPRVLGVPVSGRGIRGTTFPVGFCGGEFGPKEYSGGLLATFFSSGEYSRAPGDSAPNADAGWTRMISAFLWLSLPSVPKCTPLVL